MPKKGKKGNEQRTKGNVKAASSGRMVELMGGDSGFIGFDVVSSDSPSNGSISDDVLLGVSSGFQVVLKQLSKRDSTTKLKAMKEFISLCESEPVESVISSLKLWPLMYNKLSTDNDQRVREQSHVALKFCGLQVKKHLGPHVRSIIGPWVSGMCDPHPLSASAAGDAFTTIFSPERQIEVYKFGLKDIVVYLSNLVLKESADTFTDSKVYPEDERVERYERAVSMAINGFGHTLKQFDEDYLYGKGVVEVWQGILSEGRLWKLSRHKNPLIRSAIFRLICSLASSTHHLNDSFKQFSPLVLGGLAEKDSIVVGPLWDAVLYLLDSDKDWPTHVNIQKGVLPGLWALLEGGGFGNAERVFPCLLPLLNGLIMVYSENITFFLNFLERLSKSAFSDSARMSQADTQAIMNCFNECFLYVFKHNSQHSVQLMEIVFGLLDSILSDDVLMQHSILCTGVDMVMIGAVKVAKESEELFDRLSAFIQERLTVKMTAVVTGNVNSKLISRVGDILNMFHDRSAGPASHTEVFLPVVCEVFSVSLLNATPTNISLAQRLISHYSDFTLQVITIISKLVRPDQPADTDQMDDFDVLVNHILSLCDSNKGVEPLLVDCVVSLLCSGGKTDQLTTIAKENRDIAPLIVKKVAEKGYSVEEIIKDLATLLLPSSETFKDVIGEKYFLEFLRAMLTVNGVQSLRELPLCQDMVSLLCSVLMRCCFDSVAISMLSQLDSAIVQSNKGLLTSLLRHILDQVLEHKENIAGSADGLISCYSHILCHLPSAQDYLCSVVPLFLKILSASSDANDVLWVGLCYRCLHCGLLKTYERVYNPFKEAISLAIDEINRMLPLNIFEMFCDGDLLFTPPMSSSLTLQSSIPRSLFPCLLTGICLINDTEVLQDIAGDRLSTDTLTRNPITIEGEDDVIIPALIYMSALALYSNRGSPVNFISQLSIQNLLKAMSDLSKLVSLFPQQERDGPMWSVCLNHLLLSSCDTESWCPAVLSNLEQFHVQPLLHKIDNKKIAQDIATRNVQDVCIVTGCLMLSEGNEVITGAASSTLATIVEKHNKKELTILDDELESSKDPMVFTIFELMIRLLEEESVTLDSSVWEFIMCQMVSVVQLLADNYSDLSVGGVVMFCRGLSLCCKVNSLLTSNHSSFEEWKEFFLPAIQELLFPFFMKIKGSSRPSEMTFLHYHICRAVIELEMQPPSDRWEELIGMIATCQLYSEQVTGLLLALRALNTMTIKCMGDSGEGTDISSIQSCIGSFLFNLDLESILSTECSDSIDDYEENDLGYQYHQTVTYLLLWMTICEVVGKCDMEARVVMTEWIKEKCQLSTLLQRMVAFCNSTSPHQIKVCLKPTLSNLCNALFLRIARHLPPMLRQWFHTLDKRVSTQVMNFTSKNISPKLWKNEVKSIQGSKPKATDLEVKVYSSSMEVFVAYRVDDFSIELSVCVPDCYPLLAPTIKEGKRARVDVALWRKWLLQLNAFVANQNGTLLEGLMVWKSNLDKHFAGLEDCMICFSVIHGSNYSLPKMCCRTCKKKFHSSCLYKWFSTSAKSTCPLCRNVF